MHKPAVLALFLIACGTPQAPVDATPASIPSASAPTQAPAPSPPAPDTLILAGSRYGKIVVDGQGRTLYLFDAERGAAPKCSGGCAAAWPPLLITVAPVAGEGLSQAQIGTVARSDGSRQVSYNGHPLYYYVGDRSPGEIKCQAAIEYGGGWYVVDTLGNKITTP